MTDPNIIIEQLKLENQRLQQQNQYLQQKIDNLEKMLKEMQQQQQDLIDQLRHKGKKSLNEDMKNDIKSAYLNAYSYDFMKKYMNIKYPNYNKTQLKQYWTELKNDNELTKQRNDYYHKEVKTKGEGYAKHREMGYLYRLALTQEYRNMTIAEQKAYRLKHHIPQEEDYEALEDWYEHEFND